MVTPSLGALEPDCYPIDQSEFIDMYSFQNFIPPSNENFLQSMLKIDAPIVNLVFRWDGVPHQEPSFPFPTQRDPISFSLFGEHIPISIWGPTWVEKMSQRKKRMLAGISLAYWNHVGVNH